MVEYPLQSLAAYSHFVAELLDRSGVERSTVVVWPASPYTGIAEGEVHFSHGIRLRLREELDFDAGLITSYGYEVYRHDERLYWYDDVPSSQACAARYQAQPYPCTRDELLTSESAHTTSRD